jgi:selenocysteine-specific elongation factor
VVDVPGHERFVRAMVAGAAGIDFVLLVVAADEGVMPQTREHLAICRLLNLRCGLVALTKSDMVDDEMLALARGDAAELIADTFLADAPIVPVSAITGAGKDELLAAIEATAKLAPEKSDSGIFRLPIDRVFTIKGFGVVVTGTCIGGKIAVGDEVEILPDERRVRVRGIQVHGKAVDAAYAGQRTAVNLQGIELADLHRGALLATPDAIPPTFMLDVEAEAVRDSPRPLKRRSLVRVHCYTREASARVVPLEGDELAPGQAGKVQLRLTEPLSALPGDRIVLRSYSPVATVGGGLILNSQPRKHRAPFKDALADLDILATGDLPAKMAVHYRQAERRGVTLRRLSALLGVSEKALRDEHQKLLSQRRLIRIDVEAELSVDAETFQETKDEMLAWLTAWHAAHPLEAGVSRAELLAQPAKGADAKVMAKALAALAAESKVLVEGALARLPGHEATAGDELQEVVDLVAETCARAGLAAPTWKDLREVVGDQKKLDQALKILVQDGRVIRLSDLLVYDAAALAEAERKLIDYLKGHGEIDAQGMKTVFNLSRKWTIPLSEHFDAQKVTLRVGDKRVLRKK